MRGFLMVGVFVMTVFMTGLVGHAEAQTMPTPPGQPIPEGTPMPKDGEILNKDLKISLCKRKAQLAGKDSKVHAQSCKKDLGQPVCEQFFNKAACE